VGYERSSFAKSTFGEESDFDMLRARGFDEEQISQLWTKKSLLISRMSLYVSYLCFILALVGGFSLGIVREVPV